MNLIDENIERYRQRVVQLEQELDEMTAALTQAWDQLVPFLQETPEQAQSTQDIEPIIQAAMAAVDTEFGGIYLLDNDEWHGFPEHIALPPPLLQSLKSTMGLGVPLQWQAERAEDVLETRWIFAPIVADQRVVSAIGVGSRQHGRAFNSVDLRILSRMAERAAGQIAATQLAQSRKREAAAQRELKIASSIQRSIQPLNPPQVPGLQVSAFWEPAKQVGGDAWSWVQQPDGALAWFVLDATGKGLPAALAAMSLHTAIRVGLRMGLTPANVLQVVNEELYDAFTDTDMLATVVIGSVNPTTGQYEQANAGHPPTMVRQDGAWHMLKSTAPPVGVLRELTVYPQQLILQPQDLVICYSDGFSEIETTQGLWGEEGLRRIVPVGAKNVVALTQHIVRAAHYANIHEEFGDDQTLVVIALT